MAFGTKYALTWNDLEGVLWEIDFQVDGFAGTPTVFTGGPTPLRLSWNGGDKYQPIVGSSADIQMVYESSIDDLYVEESQTVRLIIRYDSSAIWSGFLSPGQYFKQFNKPKHYVTLTATDGLGELKNIKFEDGSGDPYYYLQTEITAISNILLKTGLVFNINEAVNIFEDNHTTGAAYSPLNQTYFYPEKYWDEDTDERGNCYDVLKDILKKYGASIRQSDNAWYIVRPNSYSVDTIYYRIFTSAGVFWGSSFFTSYDDIDSNLFYIKVDQGLYKLPGVGTCEVTQDPPIRSNMFKNGSFDSFTWDSGIPIYWDDVYSSGTSLEISESSGQLKMGSNGNAATPTEYIETNIDLHDINSANISFDWTPYYTGAPSYKNLTFQIYDGAYYLTTSGWQAGVGYYIFTAPALSTGITMRGNIDIPEQFAYGYDRNFTLRVRIYEFHNENAAAGNYVLVDNLKLSADYNKATSKVHTYDNSITINNIKSVDIAWGDSWITDLYASETLDDMFFINTYSTTPDLTEAWSITGDPTTSAYLGEVLARQTVEGFRRSIDVIRGTIRGQTADLSRVGLRDSGFTDEYGYAKRYFPTNITLDARANEWNGEWVECPATYTDEEIEWASATYTGGVTPYTITANEIEVNNCAGDGTATSDSYTAVAGEIMRVVLVITDDGSSDSPTCTIGGTAREIAWGTNYLIERFSTAGAKTIVLGGDSAGDNHNYTATIMAYSITGV